MGWADPMGALTDFRSSPSSCDRWSKTKIKCRLTSHRFDCTEDAHRNKRAKKQPSSPLSWVGIADVSESRCWSESKPTFELPPPTPLRRAVQGPHRPTMLQWTTAKTRVSKERVLLSELELEEEWTMKPRCYEKAADIKALENYKRRVASLQANFAYASRNYYDAYSRGREQGEGEGEAEGVAIDNERPSSTPIVVDERAREEPEYKLLYEKSKRERDFKLKALEMEIELATAKFEALHFTKEKVKGKEKEHIDEILSEEEKLVAIHDALAPLKDDEEAHVARVLKGRNRQEVLVMHESSNIEITGQILQCLTPGAWLNDEVINLYYELLKEREKREPKKFLKCHFFNTFFYKKLYNKTKYDYKAVRRWTTQRKIGYSLTDCDKIFIPIHKEIHWCLAIIDMRAKKFQYLDSLKGSDAHVLQVLARYIVDEAKDKTGQDLDVSTWEQEFVEELPVQENGSDCGVFMIKYADFHCRGLPLSFSQANMPYFRKRTAKEILGLRAE